MFILIVVINLLNGQEVVEVFTFYTFTFYTVPVGHIWKFDLERSKKKHLILE